MAELNEKNQNIASENAKLQGQLKAMKDAHQTAVYRLEEEVLQLREQIRDLRNIMKLEREHRFIVEEKSLAVIKFMRKSLHNKLNRSLVTQLDDADALLDIDSVTEERRRETCDERVAPCPTIEDLQEKNRLESELNLAEEKIQELERILEKVKNENIDLVKLVSSLENESLQEELTESAAKEMQEFVILEHQLSQDNIISDLRKELKSERERTAELEQRNLKHKIKIIERRLEEALSNAEKLGEPGNVEESAKALEVVEQLQKEKEAAEIEYKSIPTSKQQQQSLRVCEVCASYFGLDEDSDDRLATHSSGKIHLEFVEIRETIDRLENEIQDKQKKKILRQRI